MKTKTSIRFSLLSLFSVVALTVGSTLGATPAPAAESTEAGNNLSVPVIFAEPTAPTPVLRGVYGAPVFDGASATSEDGTTTVWLQNDANNTWQAQTMAATTPVNVSTVDWGDNLASAKLSATSGLIRVETVLRETLPAGTTMKSFDMLKVSGQGTDEMWGATQNQSDATEAIIYSGNARMTIQRMTSDPSTAQLTWDKTTGQWKGSVVDTSVTPVNLVVWQTTDGPGGYAAEINISGGLAYGYNWQPPYGGYYRLTFSLDGQNAPQALNTFITSDTQLAVSTETTAAATSKIGVQAGGGSGGEETGGGATPVLDATNNLTYIDVSVEGDAPAATATPVATATPISGGSGYAYHGYVPRTHGQGAQGLSVSSMPSQSYESGIQLHNSGSTSANGVITYYDKAGNSAGNQPFLVPGNGSMTVYGNSMHVPAGFVGSAIIDSDQPIRGIVNMVGSNPTSSEAFNVINSPSNVVNVPLFQQGNSGYNSELDIQETSGVANFVTVEFLQGNSIVGQKTFDLPAHATITVDQTNDGLTSKFVGSAILIAQQPIAVAVNQSNGQILFSTSGSGAGAPTIYAPLIMTNNHGWTSGFQVENAGSTTTTVSLCLDGASTPAATADLGPGQSVTWYPVPGTTSSSSFVGSAVVTSSNGQPLLGVVNELNNDSGQGMAYDAFTQASQSVTMPLVMFDNSGYYTGEQIQNVGANPATVDVLVNGQVVRTQLLQAGQSYTFYGDNLIPNGGKVASAVAVAREPGSQIAGIVNEVTNPQQPGDTSFAYEGFAQ